ncbi:MAG: metal ABC transporter ATP-binding protein [candidate division WOR-3 bacterium]
MNSDYILKIKNLGYTLNGTVILENINFKIEENELVSIIGPNGGGKTTLLKLILGIMKPTTGIIEFYNKNIPIGYLPQRKTDPFDFPISVYDFILLARYNGVFRNFTRYDHKKTIETIEKIGIEKLLKKRLSNLSGGELQKVLLARAIVNDPKLLILDEPTSFIDIKSQNEFYNLLFELKEKMSIILVTHDLGAISTKINRIICLNKSVNFDGDINKNRVFVMNNLYGFDVNIIDHSDHKKL